MKIKLSEEQYKKLMNEIGGYDDSMIGRQDEEAIMRTLIESYKNLTNGMNILSDLIPGVLVQDRLRNELIEVRESLVNPLNGFSELMRRIHGQQDEGHMEDSDMELDEGRKKKRKSRKKKSRKKKSKKGDRCTRIAKRKYDVWPSAYASGAVVRCRRGEIWKGLNEEDVSNVNEGWSDEYKKSIDCNNPKGFSQKAHCDGKKKASLEEAKRKKRKSKKRKLTSKPSSEGSLRDWFKRKGAKGSTGGWVDCNAPDGDGGYKSCGRQKGEKRSKYPACRPTPSACKSKGKGKKWGKKAARNESLMYHLKNNIPLNESVFRYGSDSHFNLINDARNLFKENELKLSPIEKDLVETDLGRFGYYQNELVPLDLPMELNEAEYRGKKVTLNKPKRGGPKKYYVYVKNPKTGNVKKVAFGDTTGLKSKINNPGAVKRFVERHRCKEKNDKTKPGYWSCRLPRYAKSLGLSGGGGQWW